MDKKSWMDGKGKRGQIQYFLESAFRIGFLMVALVVFFILINFYITNKIDTRQLQAEVVINRLLYSDAIMLEDESLDRTYSGIVDMQKFSTPNIDSKIDYPIKRHATAKLELSGNKDGKLIQLAYLNEDQYGNLDVLSKSKSRGQGSSTKYIRTYPVTYYSNGEYNYGTLKITVIVPNS